MPKIIIKSKAMAEMNNPYGKKPKVTLSQEIDDSFIELPDKFVDEHFDKLSQTGFSKPGEDFAKLMASNRAGKSSSSSSEDELESLKSNRADASEDEIEVLKVTPALSLKKAPPSPILSNQKSNPVPVTEQKKTRKKAPPKDRVTVAKKPPVDKEDPPKKGRGPNRNKKHHFNASICIEVPNGVLIDAVKEAFNASFAEQTAFRVVKHLVEKKEFDDGLFGDKENAKPKGAKMKNSKKRVA